MNKRHSKQSAPNLRFPEFSNNDHWQTENANELFKEIKDTNHNGDLPVLAITQDHGAIPRDLIDYNVSVTEKSVQSYKVVREGNFIISLRSFQGGIEHSSYRGICSPAYVILEKRNDLCEGYWKQYLKTNSFIRILTKNIEGLRDGKMISYKQFSDLVLPVPCPAEQQKVANCLSSIDNLIAAQAKKVDALRAHKKGLMQQLFPKKGESIPSVRFSEFQDDNSWKTMSIEEIAFVKSGGTPLRTRGDYWNGNIPWITTSQINFNVIKSAEQFITESGLNNSAAKVFDPNTVLMAMYGQGKTRGKVAILGFKASTNQACAAIQPKDGHDPQFIFHVLSSRYEQLRSLSNQGGQNNLSAELIKDFQISIPSEKSGEQQKIANILSKADALISLGENRLLELQSNKRGLIQQLFPLIEKIK